MNSTRCFTLTVGLTILRWQVLVSVQILNVQNSISIKTRYLCSVNQALGNDNNNHQSAFYYCLHKIVRPVLDNPQIVSQGKSDLCVCDQIGRIRLDIDTTPGCLDSGSFPICLRHYLN